MKESIFRQKTIDRISSPEQLDEYVKVSNPGIWTLLIAIIFLLAGVCVWGVFGRVERSIPCAVVSSGGEVKYFIDEVKMDSTNPQTEIRLENGTVLKVSGVNLTPMALSKEDNAELLHMIDSETDDAWVLEGTLEDSLPEGTYYGQFLLETIKPISFVVN